MTCTYFRIIINSTAYHHLQITWLSYFGSENQGLPLRSWFVTCWLWRHIPIVTSLAVPSSCVVTQTPMGTNSGTRRRKRKFPLLFVNRDRGRIEIDHLYGLRCRGWYCNPEQHSLHIICQGITCFLSIWCLLQTSNVISVNIHVNISETWKPWSTDREHLSIVACACFVSVCRRL